MNANEAVERGVRKLKWFMLDNPDYMEIRRQYCVAALGRDLGEGAVPADEDEEYWRLTSQFDHAVMLEILREDHKVWRDNADKGR